MRPALMLGGIVGVLVTALPGQAQAPPDVRQVIVRDVLVRSGPNDKYYATSRLMYGERVVVKPQPPDKVQAGWLAIEPPRGSFSWINQRFVQVIQAGTGMVVADTPIPILVGSSETKDQPTTEGTKAARGSQVIILDKPNVTDSGVWLPIWPQPGEMRYIPENAVQPVSAAPAVAANMSNPGAPRPAIAPGVPLVAPTPPVGTQGASLPARATAGQQPGYPGTVVGAAAPTAATGQPNTSLYSTASATAGASNGAAKWSEYGELRRTAFQEADGRPVYALVDAQGHTRLYATPLPGLTLEPYLGRRLTMYGPMNYNQVERVNEMTVSHVAPLPAQNRY